MINKETIHLIKEGFKIKGVRKKILTILGESVLLLTSLVLCLVYFPNPTVIIISGVIGVVAVVAFSHSIGYWKTE